MIISHKHKFIFMKTRKTAGTSIQTALTEICGDDDIISSDIDTIGRNEDKSCWDGHPHPHLWDVKNLLSDKIFNSYFKFAFVRNPFDVTVSRFYWNINGKGQKGYELTKDGFNKWIEEYTSMSMFHKAEYYPCNMAYPFLFSDNFVNSDYSMINYDLRGRSFDLDFVGRYENLVGDFDYICQKLNLEKISLPNKKGGMRKKKSYKEMYTEESTNKVKKAFSNDLDLLGYGFNQNITISKRDILIDRSNFVDIDKNINGASLIKIPDWVKNPLGKYYLYFASHSGKYIRLAYSDMLTGPYKIYKEGTLKLNQTNCKTHIASPDIHIDNDKHKILMYYHGDTETGQKSFLGCSDDGIDFIVDNKVLGEFYFRVFNYKNKIYSIAKNKNEDSVIYQSDSYYGEFKKIFNILPNSRHTAVYLKDDYLFIFYTLVGDAPELIYYCKLKISDNIEDWDVISNHILTPPQFKFEGADSQLIPSNFGSATHRYGEMNLNELRDPCIFEENGGVYILYTFNGEAGIALGRLNYNE
jgi:hypothetical protein